MSEQITLELPDELAHRARAVAHQTRRRLEDVLVEWIQHAGAEPPVEFLADDQVLALCDSQMEPGQQQELSDLLGGNREGQLLPDQRVRLAELLQTYRRGLVRKAQALQIAVARGLRPRLN